MGRFVDRKDELATLEQQYALEEASLVVLYGRRRVGKTALITEFVKGKRSLYFLATEESESQNRRAFQREVARSTGNALLAAATVDQWDVLFDIATQGEERIVIAIDEFQYLGKSNAAFPSVFQRIWDTVLSRRNVMVILCGSLVSLMESQTLAYDSPLYGRRAAQIQLKQIPFASYPDFFPAKTPAHRLVELYSVTGGVPKYIESFLSDGDLYESIADNVLNPNSYLYDEPNFLLSKEVSEVGTYFSLIKSIAQGNRKLGTIASAAGIKQTSMAKYLKTLESLDVLERTVPVTEKHPEKSKKGLYAIKDNYLRFWFRFVFPNLGLLETGRRREVLQAIKRNLVDGQTAYAFEGVCRALVWELADRGRIPFSPERVGAWWGCGDVEIDVAAVSEREHRAVLGECKFWTKPVGENVLAHLEAQASRALGDPSFAPYREAPVYALFSISGFTDELREIASARNDVALVGPQDIVTRS